LILDELNVKKLKEVLKKLGNEKQGANTKTRFITNKWRTHAYILWYEYQQIYESRYQKNMQR